MDREAHADLLVGRDEELARLGAVVSAAAEGRPAAMLVAGEAGLGKTSLIRALQARLGDSVDVVWASCLPLSRLMVPFLPLRSALHEWALTHPEAATADPAHQLDWAEAPLEFNAWLMHRDRPVLLVVDDLQWADRSTLDVLMYVLAGLVGADPGGRRLAVVATLRTGERTDGDELDAWLADVTRFPRVEQLRLGPLDRLQTRRQLTRLLGGEPTESLVEDVFTRALGNPYWARLLAEGLSPDAAHLPAGLPSQLRQAVTRTWTRLPAPAREVTRLVAIGGAPQDAGRLADVAGASGVSAVALDQVRVAVDAGVLVLSPGGGYWFAHPLTAEVLVAGMLPEERALVHAAFATVLDRIAAGPAQVGFDLASQLADHHYGADHPQEAYRWALSAVAVADGSDGVAQAIRLLQRAVDLGDRVDGALPRRELLERIRTAADRVGDQLQELAAVEGLLQVVQRAREPLVVARLLVRRMNLRIFTGHEFAGLADVQDAVGLTAGAPDSPEHALAMAELAHAQLWNAVANGPDTAEEAVRLARACGSPQAVAHALSSRAMARVFGDRGTPAPLEDAVADGGEAQQAALRARDWWAYTHATFWKANAIDGPTSPEYLDELQAGRDVLICAAAPHSYVAWVSSAAAATLLHLGRWQECETRLREVFGFSPGPLADAGARLVAAQLACRQGRQQEAHDHLARAEEILGGHAGFINLEFDATRAELAVAAGQPARALALALEHDNDDVPPTSVERILPLAAQALAERIQACRDRHEDPEEFLSQFRQLRRRRPEVYVEPGPGAHYHLLRVAMQAWYDAEFARAENDAPAAAWIRAADSCRAALLPWDEAYAQSEAAQILILQRATRPAGVAALRRSHDLAGALQATPMLTRIATLARSARVRLMTADDGPAPVQGSVPGLTAREREILEHIVAGLTYAEIARTLVISPKTVSVHVSNLLRKTGTRGRVELAQLVNRTRR